jgi:hypothetical protein
LLYSKKESLLPQDLKKFEAAELRICCPFSQEKSSQAGWEKYPACQIPVH